VQGREPAATSARTESEGSELLPGSQAGEQAIGLALIVPVLFLLGYELSRTPRARSRHSVPARESSTAEAADPWAPVLRFTPAKTRLDLVQEAFYIGIVALTVSWAAAEIAFRVWG